MTTPRRAVYTAVIGGYETVLTTPPESDVDYICFTDDTSLTSTRWQIEQVSPLFPADPVRSARHLKILGHPKLDGYDETLWVDNRVEILVDPADLLASWLAEADLSMPSHSYRETVIDEFVAVLEGGFDDPARIQEQLFHYLTHDAEALQERPYWTAIIARRPTAEVTQAMATWRDQVLRYSRRDQLSVNVAMRRAGLNITIQPIDSFGSGQHDWHTFEQMGRLGSETVRQAALTALLPPSARLRDLERQRVEDGALISSLREAADGLAQELVASEGERRRLDGVVNSLQEALDSEASASAAVRSERDDIHTELAILRAELTRVQTERDALAVRCDEILQSTSWKVLAPLRALGARRRGGVGPQ